jgi:hypothetical protein
MSSATFIHFDPVCENLQCQFLSLGFYNLLV